jgi:glycine cleavage system H protein
VTGEVVEVNEDLLDAPESINEDPYDAWFVRVNEVTEVGELLDAEAYAALCEQEA